jgi:hypothetical protein
VDGHKKEGDNERWLLAQVPKSDHVPVPPAALAPPLLKSHAFPLTHDVATAGRPKNREGGRASPRVAGSRARRDIQPVSPSPTAVSLQGSWTGPRMGVHTCGPNQWPGNQQCTIGKQRVDHPTHDFRQERAHRTQASGGLKPRPTVYRGWWRLVGGLRCVWQQWWRPRGYRKRM